MANETCGTCRHWRHDETNSQDRKMVYLDRKPCSLATDAHARGRFFHFSTVACRRYLTKEPITKHYG